MQARLNSDPEFAAAVAALRARDERTAERGKRILELRESSTGLSPQENAARWLRFVLEDWESFGELEALVYFASRGYEHNEHTRQVIRAWKHGEQRAIDNCREGNTSIPQSDGTIRRVGGMPQSEASDIENRSSYQLMNFWNSGRGPHPTEATMFRVVEWCKITGFESWWRRFARETKEDILLGGPDPQQLIWWLFDMCRSTYAITLMSGTLRRAFDVVSVRSTFRRQPWIFGHDKRLEDGTREFIYEEDLAYASALAWCSKRLAITEDVDLIRRAIDTLAKHQLESGGWAYSSGSEEPSIEVTALAIHAIAAVGHPRSEDLIGNAVEWLTKQQDQAGYWSEDSSPNPVHLSVLVLDALEIGYGRKPTTIFGTQSATPIASRNIKSKRATHRTVKRQKRFRVALSFPGEVRTDVKVVADDLANALGNESVFYDKNFKAELARPNLDVYLQNIYSKDCDLVVIWACQDYAKKKWCGIEWRAIRSIINDRRDDEVMIIKMGDFSIDGLFDHDGYIDGLQHSGKEIAQFILERLLGRVAHT